MTDTSHVWPNYNMKRSLWSSPWPSGHLWNSKAHWLAKSEYVHLGKLMQLRIENMEYGNLKSVSIGYENLEVGLLQNFVSASLILRSRITHKALQLPFFFAFECNTKALQWTIFFFFFGVSETDWHFSCQCFIINYPGRIWPGSDILIWNAV